MDLTCSSVAKVDSELEGARGRDRESKGIDLTPPAGSTSRATKVVA